jgi:hypothetical protein
MSGIKAATAPHLCRFPRRQLRRTRTNNGGEPAAEQRSFDHSPKHLKSTGSVHRTAFRTVDAAQILPPRRESRAGFKVVLLPTPRRAFVGGRKSRFCPL